jgi:hypothetical protein
VAGFHGLRNQRSGAECGVWGLGIVDFSSVLTLIFGHGDGDIVSRTQSGSNMTYEIAVSTSYMEGQNVTDVKISLPVTATNSKTGETLSKVIVVPAKIIFDAP